jgi:hypothetical protein
MNEIKKKKKEKKRKEKKKRFKPTEEMNGGFKTLFPSFDTSISSAKSL